MTNSMIEKAARAMWEARAAHFGEVVMPMERDERYELFLSYARAVLTAIREPNEAMMEAPPPIAGENPGVREIWQDMLDSILEGT